MKMIIRLFLAAFILIMGVLVNAQPPCPTCPPGGGGGGGGGTTPGAPASPIDMYVYILAFAAILFIVIYVKKMQKKQTV